MSQENTLDKQAQAEVLNQSNTLEQLKRIRHEAAEVDVQRGAVSAMRSADRITQPRTGITDIPTKFGLYDVGQLHYGDSVAMEAIGWNPTEVATVLDDDPVANDGESLFTATLGDETIEAARYGRHGLTLRFHSATEQPVESYDARPVVLRSAVVARFERSPAHVAIHALLDTVAPGDTPSLLETQPFDPNEDALGTLAVLEDVGMFGWGMPDHELLSGAVAPATLLAQTERLVVEHDSENGDIVYKKHEQAITKSVRVDAKTGYMSVAFSTDPGYAYQERSNSDPSSNEAPFVETVCAQQLLDGLAVVGLTLHPTLQVEMVRVGQAERFGGIYTQLSRELAKWVNRDNRVKVANLFVPDAEAARLDGNKLYYGKYQTEIDWQRSHDVLMNDEQRAEEEATVRARLLAVDTSAMGEAARLIFELAQGAIRRDAAADELTGSLPLTHEDISISEGACFDVATYYVQATTIPGKLCAIYVDGVSMLEKTHGSHTFMLNEPTLLNGVRLPKGTLMQRGGDEGWAMLRLTPFCFDDPIDQLATGSELAKAYANESQAIHAIGGVSLLHMIAASRW